IAAITHDHIVTIYDINEDRGVPFLVMQYLLGESLEARVRRQGEKAALPLAETLRIGREIAQALAAIHERGLVHRDIKPANLWLEAPTGRVKVLDFGLARSTQGEEHLTQAGAIVGSPAYMAPEQASKQPLDSRADLFSLGVALYLMATGELPFQGDDPLAVLLALTKDDPVPPHERNAGVPAALSELIMRLLAKKPEARPGT